MREKPKDGGEMKKYIAEKDYESIYINLYEDTFESNNMEEKIEAWARKKNIAKYRVKSIRSGKMLEVLIYPLWDTKKDKGRTKKARESRVEQKNLNEKNAKLNLIRLINTNFTEKDIWITTTYSNKTLPKNEGEADRNIKNYMRRLAYAAKKKGIQTFKYFYVTEYEYDPIKGTKRVHHHVIANFPDRDLAEELWDKGGRTQSRRLQPDDYGLEGLARYICKDPKGKKRYCGSKNMDKPIITVADNKITKTRASMLAVDTELAEKTFTKLYKGYKFNDIKSYYADDDYGGIYLHVRMVRDNSPEGHQKKQRR